MELTLAIIVFVVVLSSLKVVNEYERGVKFTLGKFSGIIKPGLRMVLPIIQTWNRVDIRTKAIDVPDQDAITKDNVSVFLNAVLFYKVSDSEKAIIQVEDYNYAVSQLAQTSMRDVVGETELDELLSKRDQISQRIREVVDKATDPWGVKVEAVELKHVGLPETMKRTIAKQAEAERERRAVIINAEGEVKAADNIAKAASTLAKSPGALHLRTLQSINDISSDQSNTVIFTVPLEILKAFTGFKDKK